MRLFAPPPTAGWGQGELAVLMATGAADAVVALVVVTSLRSALRGEARALARITATLAAASYSAIVFAAVTLSAGVWAGQLAYWIEALLFAPLPVALWYQLRQGTG